ncbi:MAG: CRISPR-associated endonuclease Cas2 [Muribaculaceae bacterium]
MLVISYDIKDDKLRTKFSKMITRNGAVRLQLSVYEVNSTKRVIENIKIKINTIFAPKFCFDDSIMIFNVNNDNIIKYGNAIHRDKDLLFFE